MKHVNDRVTVRAGFAALFSILILAAALSASIASAGGEVGVAAPPVATTLNAGATDAYWTPQRIEAAQPLDLAEGEVDEGTAAPAPDLFSASATPFGSTEVNKVEKYPNRVHGKLIGTFAGVGDYSCSATVISSGSGSLVLTAGHCVFDAGGTNRFATNLAFIPGYSRNSVPLGIWQGTNAITTKGWVRKAALDYDFALIRVGISPFGTLQSVVGSRGIGFDQKRKQRLSAYGYPAKGNPRYNGDRLIRCDSGYLGDPYRSGGPRSRGMRCDMQQGASGGGWVSQHSFVISDTSHGYPQLSKRKIFGPYFGAVAKSLYKSNSKAFPSIGPIGCNGKVATIVATNQNEKIRGTKGKDIIATLGGNDQIKGRGGSDIICAGAGNDRVIGGGGKDRIIGGDGYDKCGGSKGNDSIKQCEKKRKART